MEERIIKTMTIDTSVKAPILTLLRDEHSPVYVLSKSKCDIYENDAVAICVWGRLCFEGNLVNAQQLAQQLAGVVGLDELYDKFSGKFCVAYFNHKTQILEMVNDHMSIQPGFYSSQPNGLYIADSLDQLKQASDVQCTISNQAIYHYFYFHCIPAPHTIYQECNKLEPAHRLRFIGEQLPQSLNLYNPKFNQSVVEPDTEKRCMQIIEEAVKSSTAVDAGAFLSGGLDSSTVAGMLAKNTSPAKTFSIGFNVEAYDETPYAQITAEHFGTDHQVLYLTPEDAVGAFTQVAQYFDEPFGNSSAMAAYFCAKFAKEHGVNTLLAGDGGDELFAGNGRYAKQKTFELFGKLPNWLQQLNRSIFVNDVIGKLPVAKKVASYIKQAEINLPGRLESYNFINQFGAQSMFEQTFLEQIDTGLPLKQQKQRFEECQDDDPVNQMLYLDWKFTLADNDLVKVSKMCELAGVNVEYPLLDKSVVDFSCTIPAPVKLPGGKLRDFYKRACQGFLSDKTLTKSKHGFGLPFGAWMKENAELQQLTLDCLASFKQRNIVQQSLIEDALAAHQSVHAGYYGELIWIMVILELWLQGHE